MGTHQIFQENLNPNRICITSSIVKSGRIVTAEIVLNVPFDFETRNELIIFFSIVSYYRI